MEDTQEIQDIIFYFKEMAINQPDKLLSLLKENSNLLCAVMYLLIKSKLVDESVVVKIFKDSLDVENQENQIEERIKSMDSKFLTDETKTRIEKLKYLISKKN
ncbi:hypothetical protein A0H76_2322 [Hepatospora eriocheir]|uniref:Cleavage stimulation factor subunit 2 hinge domain-containing protein n=1 Tax=Hepatospora eriocheir TaxID=1081669 RepID=A0A1X0QB34_9MICR|nr:hypothetical protein HERIO_1105 [Hepatospora eriocheir]ORE00086.1 hypothetical protein A0H76_2322 [Hepatospora eriocheir]